jgi:hypothetical protein
MGSAACANVATATSPNAASDAISQWPISAAFDR